MVSVWDGSWGVNVYNAQPSATLSCALANDAETAQLTLDSPFDPSELDTQAGFRVSFSGTYAGLAQTYAGAEAWPEVGSPTAQFDTQDDEDQVYYARIYDRDGGYSDYASTYVLPTVNTPAITDTSVQITWLDVAEGESSWIVQRALYGGSFSTIATLSPDSTGFLDANLSPGTRYQWRVRAAGTPGTAEDTAWSAKRAVTTIAPPSNLKLVNLRGTSDGWRLEWQNNTGCANGVEIEVSEDGETWQPLTTLPRGASSFGLPDQGQATTMRFHIRAISSGFAAEASEPSADVGYVTLPSGTDDDDLVQFRTVSNNPDEFEVNLNNSLVWTAYEAANMFISYNAGLGSDHIVVQSFPTSAYALTIFGGPTGDVDQDGNFPGDWDGQAYGSDTLEVGTGNLDGMPAINFLGGDPGYLDYNYDPAVPHYVGGADDPVIIHDENVTDTTQWDIHSYVVRRTHGNSLFGLALSDLSDNGDREGMEIYLGSGDDVITATAVNHMLIHAGSGNDQINLPGQDAGGYGAVGGLTVLGGLGDDAIIAGVDPSIGSTDPRHGSMEGFGENTIYGDGLTYNATLNGQDSLEVYDDWNSFNGSIQYDMHQDGIFRPTWWSFNYYGAGRIENLALHMQNDNASHSAPTFNVSLASPSYIATTVYPGAMNDRIYIAAENVTQPPVHIKPSGGIDTDTGPGDNAGDTIVADVNARVVLDYDPATAINLYNLYIYYNAAVTIDPAAPGSCIATVKTLEMNRDYLEHYGTLNLEYADFRADVFKDTFYSLIDGEVESITTTGIEGTRLYLWRGYHPDNDPATTPTHTTTETHPGDWLGEGIRSSRAAYDYSQGRKGSDEQGRTGVGWNPYGSNGVRLRYTWAGDTDLDRDVDSTDLGHLSAHWQTTVWSSGSGTWGTVWYYGDFTYNTQYATSTDPNPNPNPSLWCVDIIDFSLMCYSNWGLNATNLAAWAPN